MVGRGSPMIPNGSPRFSLIVNQAAHIKKKSPKARLTKRDNNQDNKRASWNSLLEKSLVDLLYDGHIAEGTYNVNSTHPPQHPVRTQVDNVDELSHIENTFPSFEETWAYSAQQDANAREHITIEEDDEIVARTEERVDKRAAATTRNKEEKETKKPKKQSSSDIAGSMDRYIAMRERQFEIESSQMANEKNVAQAGDYTIKRCISEMMTMEISTNEKAIAFDVFKDPNNREIFLSSKEDDPQAALLWLRRAVAKLSQVV